MERAQQSVPSSLNAASSARGHERPAQEPTASVLQLVPAMEALAGYGGCAEPLLRRFRLPDPGSASPTQRVPQSALCDFWDACAEASGDPVFGLRIGIVCARKPPPAMPQVMLHLARHAATLGDVIAMTVHYERLCEEGRRGELLVDGERAIWRWHTTHGARFSRPFSEHVLGALSKPELWAARDPAEVELLEVHFPLGAPSDLSLYASHFGVPLRFGCGYQAIVFSRASLAARAPSGDASLAPLLMRVADEELGRVPSIACFAEQVRAELARPRTHEPPPSAVAMAKRLGVGERTLRRRLAEEHTSYYELVDEFRKSRAQALMSDRRRSLLEVAFMLGFSEQNSFSRAYRRWFGVAPNSQRRRAPEPRGS
jgi:AraC-like DNA-binding protein